MSETMRQAPHRRTSVLPPLAHPSTQIHCRCGASAWVPRNRALRSVAAAIWRKFHGGAGCTPCDAETARAAFLLKRGRP